MMFAASLGTSVFGYLVQIYLIGNTERVILALFVAVPKYSMLL